MTRINGDLKARLLATFRSEGEEHVRAIASGLQEIERAPPGTDTVPLIETVFREMHTLKGAARSVSLAAVETLCKVCEAALSQHVRQCRPMPPALVSALRDATDGLKQAIQGGTQSLPDRLARNVEIALEAPAAPTGGGTPLPASSTAAGSPSTEPALQSAEPPASPAPASETSANAPTSGAAPQSRQRTATRLPDLVEGGASASPLAAASSSIRVDVSRLDDLILRAEDLFVPKLAAQERTAEARALGEAVTRARAVASAASSGATGDSDLSAALRDVAERSQRLLRRLQSDQRGLRTVADGMLRDTRALRMSPASTMLDALPSMARSIAREESKEVELAVSGAEIEVDRKVLDALRGSLIHAVRNAVDHGIELPDERAAAGKPRRGRIDISVAAIEGGKVRIVVADDGRGIDTTKVRESAIRNGILRSEAECPDEEQVLDLVFRSGLSTSPIITDVSGHGLGLAIVREQAERIDGTARIETVRGGGTRITITVPAAVVTFRGILVAAGGQRFLVPLESAARAIRVKAKRIERVAGRDMVRWRGEAIPFVALARLLGLRAPDAPAAGDRLRCIVVAWGRHLIALAIDELLGLRDALVKELAAPLQRVSNISAAGVLGTGEIALILRPSDLVKTLQTSATMQNAGGAPAGPRRRVIVLVVDDSITTRTMERNLFEAAGFDVRTAVDGMEAWETLRRERVDIVVSDVDMPRMDGFTLTSRIRADSRLAELPVVLVTALESQKDKERGIEVGANAYITKSNFDQTNLIEIIRRVR